ncbi:DUF3043 domain-containing protein [Tessaracoccus sp. HDW20]|uniref:DUF3043 domain-containing protein n=1 Tax=Tessaracoccus coleopterorum TaxID=2714950 RepID=UPI0018D307A9|nr:DUF3043 domain-containing protein [Tessaracoccus coleopterorum]
MDLQRVHDALFILIMAATMATMTNVVVSSYILISMWVVIGMVVINTFFIWRGFKKEFAGRFPSSSHKGLMFYLFNRSIMLRRFRQPSPRIKRGTRSDELPLAPGGGVFSASALEEARLLKDFESQEAAEEWLGLFFDELLEQGVTEVGLYEEDRLVYGPMALTP